MWEVFKNLQVETYRITNILMLYCIFILYPIEHSIKYMTHRPKIHSIILLFIMLIMLKTCLLIIIQYVNKYILWNFYLSFKIITKCTLFNRLKYNVQDMTWDHFYTLSIALFHSSFDIWHTLIKPLCHCFIVYFVIICAYIWMIANVLSIIKQKINFPKNN